MASSIGSLDGTSTAAVSGAVSAASSQPPATASADLAKLESQLSDWVHCPSSKTSAAKAKIAEITDKIDAIKAKVEKSDVEKIAPPQQQQTLRLDGLGAWLNEQA